MSTRAERREAAERPGRLGLGALLLAGIGSPVIWGGHLIASYVYVPAACAGAPHWGLHVFTLVAVLALAGVLAVSFLLWRGRLPVAGTRIRGSAYLGVFGVIASVYFGAVILLEAIPNFAVDPCQGLGLPVARAFAQGLAPLVLAVV